MRTEFGYQCLPPVRVRDNLSLSPNQVRVRFYADILLDKEFTGAGEAVNEILRILCKVAKK